MHCAMKQEISKSVPEEKDVDEYGAATATAMARDQNEKVHSLIRLICHSPNRKQVTFYQSIPI